MKKILWLLYFCVSVHHSLLAQSGNGNGSADFMALLRELDLNEATQNRYAITQAEYERLKMAWQNLSQPVRSELLYGSSALFWTGTLVPMLLNDLNKGNSWEMHLEGVASYGGQDLSLTLSRLHHPKATMTVTHARKMLLDLLREGVCTFMDGRFEIDEDFRTQAKERAGAKAHYRLEKWERLINEYQSRSEWDMINAVNAFFNNTIQGAADEESTGGDYWQSPLETLVRGRGDCDDFAMAKYISLRLLRIPPERLRVAAVKYPYGHHAVLLFFPSNERDPWVLDNLRFEHLRIFDSHILRLSGRIELHNLEPIWSVNEKFWTRFEDGVRETTQEIDSFRLYPKFATALMHSQKLLTLITHDAGREDELVACNCE
jgi:predicted transglutaminase-like cysteine proteinase